MVTKSQSIEEHLEEALNNFSCSVCEDLGRRLGKKIKGRIFFNILDYPSKIVFATSAFIFSKHILEMQISYPLSDGEAEDGSFSMYAEHIDKTYSDHIFRAFEANEAKLKSDLKRIGIKKVRITI